MRKKKISASPQTFREADSMFREPDYSYLGRTIDGEEMLYQVMVGEDREESLISCTKRQLQMVHQTDVIASDPTFRVTRRLVGALYLMIIAILAYDAGLL
ncbi:hypothetical protein FOCC_FOCC011140 [Frankliniella occidentalis]|nr:hypothetical protein FOCC_FOCC011140 [Frankliniella occidentalis]